MKILERILEEINEIHYPSKGIGCGLEDIGITDRYEAAEYGWNEAVKRIAGIISSHMKDDGWTPIEEGLPQIGEPLIVTIKDQLQGNLNELRYPVYYEKDSIKDGYHWSWRYGDFAYELLPGVSEVIAWRPLPKPYHQKPERRTDE